MTTESQGPIVVGVDGSDESLLAVRYAVQEAQRQGCGLRLVHATPETAPMAPMLPLIDVQSWDQVGYRIVNEAMQLGYDMTDGEIEVEKVVRSGSRVHTLMEATEDARLIVLGHRDRSVLGRVFSGSTCSGVASRAPCPVVCVPTVWAPDNRHGRIVVGVEGQKHSQDALAVAFVAAAERNATLTVLHAWKLQSPYDDLIDSRVDVESLDQSATAMLGEILREWTDDYPEVDIEIDVRHQHTLPALVDASAGADLLVLGRRGRAAPLGIHLGSIARAVIREASCPVEIAPPRTSRDTPPSDRLLTADQMSPQA